jgi:drug/metabolite transporter (DMT)-like permease
MAHDVERRPTVVARYGSLRTGLAFALVSALAFGSSGPMARALFEAGWTPGGAVLVRLGGGALVLCLAVALRWRTFRPHLTAPTVRLLLVYGVVAMAAVQLTFFNALRTLDVAVALMIEYLAPVLLLAWTSARTRTLPRPVTLLAAAGTLVGLALVLDLGGGGDIDPVGVVWALLAAVCLAAYFAISQQDRGGVPPLLLAAGGMLVGAVVMGLAALVGLVPVTVTTAMTTLGGERVSWLVPAVWLALVASAGAYVLGIAAIGRLGSRVASFVSLTEVLFAVLAAWVLLAQVPTPVQVVGGLAIVGGIVVIQREEGRRARAAAAPTAAAAEVRAVAEAAEVAEDRSPL